MSQYVVTYHEKTTPADAEAVARIMYDHHHWPAYHFTWLEYMYLAVPDACELSSLVCTCNGIVVGGLSVGRTMQDSSFPGMGVVVYNAAVHPDHPRATRLLYRTLRSMLKDIGADWYHTTARLSETEYRSKFRRV